MQTFYEILGVSETCDQATVRSTYLRLLQIYHPDHNSDSGASARTAKIIEAYSTLCDPVKRKAYDDSLRPAKARVNSGESKKRPPEEPVKPLVCQDCKMQDSSLRLSVMYWVFSVIFLTKRGAKVGIWCERCRAMQSALSTTVAGALGWWGIPWGPVYTIHALYFNALGGKQDREQNAALLRIVAYDLYQDGKRAEALTALDKSLSLQKDQPSEDFAKLIRDFGVTPISSKKRSAYRVFNALPSLAVIVCLALCFDRVMSEPKGYAARYEAPDLNASVTSLTKQDESARDEVNGLVDRLAQVVKEHATYVGRRQVGTSTVNQYELDRAKYDEKSFSDLARQIQPYLSSHSANYDGFASSAYFNASIMRLSVGIERRLSEGRDIADEVAAVHELERDTVLNSWLTASPVRVPFLKLLENLDFLQIVNKKLKGMGNSTEVELVELKSVIQSTKDEFEQAKAQGDLDIAREIARRHDRAVDRYNDLVRQRNRIIPNKNQLDLAFNRCLDPKILMSKFEEVDLTSESDSGAAKP